jgi:hypothetical protein
LTAAAATEQSATKEKNLLDFLAIFREYTKEEKVNYSSSVLYANIETLESVTRELYKAAPTQKLQNCHPSQTENNSKLTLRAQ